MHIRTKGGPAVGCLLLSGKPLPNTQAITTAGCNKRTADNYNNNNNKIRII